jgi:histidyl-tRNA synthetase
MTTLNLPPPTRSRGMRDLLPGDMRAFRRVEDAFRAATGRWGYDEIRTPTLETYSLFTITGGLTPDMLSRVYSFLDWDGWSGDRVVLRPDSTIPVARAATEAALPLPARLCYVQNVFRFQASDDRETWQCGLEYLGAPAPQGDLEVAALGCEVLEALGLKPVVRIGHVGLVRAASEAAGGAGFAAGGASALAGLRENTALASALRTFVDLASRPLVSVEAIDNVRALAPAGAVAAIDDVAGVARALTDSGRDVVIDFGMPRDFAYYTGVVYEFQADGETWGQGGRYAPGGEATPATACGLALDLDHLARHVSASTRRRTSVSVVPVGATDLSRAMAVARALHRGGIAAALAAHDCDTELCVRVSGERLSAHTPDGDRDMTSLDDLVGLLVQFK